MIQLKEKATGSGEAYLADQRCEKYSFSWSQGERNASDTLEIRYNVDADG